MPGWTSMAPSPITMNVFACVFARVMVGPELCGNEWQRISLQYTSTILETQMAVVLRYHPWLRRFAKYVAPEVKKLARLRREAAEFTRPVLECRHAATADGKGRSPTSQDRPEDAIQRLMDEHAARGRRVSAGELVQNIFITMVASLHNTSTVALSILFDLLDHPEHLGEIRAEIARVQSQQAGGTWTRQGLAELRALDSCMRENLRAHSFNEGRSRRSNACVPPLPPSSTAPSCAHPERGQS